MKNTKGFTLIELLLYTTIVGTLLVAVSLFLGLTLDSRVKSQSMTEVNQQGIFVMDYVTRVVRGSDSIASPAAGNSGSSLTLAIGSSSTVFSANGGYLQVQEGASSPVRLTNDKVEIRNLTFSNLSRSGTNGLVRVSFDLARVNTTGKNEYDFQKTFTTSVVLKW